MERSGRPPRERRQPLRPANGALARCPHCASGMLEFNERYRLALDGQRYVVTPAWVCDGAGCHFWRPVRRETLRAYGPAARVRERRADKG